MLIDWQDDEQQNKQKSSKKKIIETDIANHICIRGSLNLVYLLSLCVEVTLICLRQHREVITAIIQPKAKISKHSPMLNPYNSKSTLTSLNIILYTSHIQIIPPMQYRNHLRPDPFSASRQYISTRLQILQEAILSKFRAGTERQMMRVTINQLLNTESTLEGKINRLSTVMQQIEVCGQNMETLQSEGEYAKYYISNGFVGQIRDIGTQYSAKRFQKYSNLYESQDYRRTPISHYQSYKPYPQQQLPYAYSQINNRESLNDKQLSSLRSSKSSNNLQKSNYLNRTDSINQNDLFSFRTQQASSPFTQSKEIFGRKQIQKRQNPYDYLYYKERGQSKSLKDSQKSGKSKSLSKSKDSKQMRKSINYDGKGLVFKASRINYKDNKSPQSKNKQKIDQSQLLKRIQKRISCSKCVVDTIEHSISSTNNSYIANRFKQEKHLRSQLMAQLQLSFNNANRWR